MGLTSLWIFFILHPCYLEHVMFSVIEFRQTVFLDQKVQNQYIKLKYIKIVYKDHRCISFSNIIDHNQSDAYFQDRQIRE